jgi:hypothetical protein
MRLPSRNNCQPGSANRDNFAIPVNNRVLLSSDILRGAPYSIAGHNANSAGEYGSHGRRQLQAGAGADISGAQRPRLPGGIPRYRQFKRRGRRFANRFSAAGATGESSGNLQPSGLSAPVRGECVSGLAAWEKGNFFPG